MEEKNGPVKIIGNESNSIIEVDGSSAPAAAEPATENRVQTGENETAERSTNEIATADGGLIETLDTALHNKPGVSEGEQLSGSNRADYYESRSQGKTDSAEELDALNNNTD